VLLNLLRSAVQAASDEDGWVNLGAAGSILTKQRPDFDSCTWGYAKLSDLMTATTLFVIDRRSPGDGKPAALYVRDNNHQPIEVRSDASPDRAS
jgi:hypothetical protein